MFPHFHIFGYEVSMYAVWCLAGIGLAVAVSVLRSGKTGIPRDDTLYAFLFGIIGLLIGAKLLYLITVAPRLWVNRSVIAENPKLLLELFTGGFVYYGGIIGAASAVVIYCKKYKIKALGMLDTVAPAIPLAHALGRVGCFFAGCCYGMEYHGPLAVTFPGGVPAPAGVPLLPVQLIEAAINLILFAVLMFIGRKKRHDGLMLGIYIVSYALVRFVLEFFRGDADRGAILSISTSQWISLLLLPLGILLIFQPRRGSEEQAEIQA